MLIKFHLVYTHSIKLLFNLLHINIGSKKNQLNFYHKKTGVFYKNIVPAKHHMFS